MFQLFIALADTCICDRTSQINCSKTIHNLLKHVKLRYAFNIDCHRLD